MAQAVTVCYPEGALLNKVVINRALCKGCGICVSLCSKVLAMDSMGKAVVKNQSLCTGCAVCETHCPDFAITAGVK